MGQRGDRLADMRDGLDRLVQPFEAGARSRRPQTGADPSGQVRVTLDREGRLANVVVSAHWAGSLDASELGPAVMQAALVAGQAAMDAWGEAVVEGAEGERRARPAPMPHTSLGAQLEELVSTERLAQQSDAALEALVDLLERAVEDVDSVGEAVESLVASTRTGESQGARVTVNGAGDLTAIEIDAQWASRSHAANISRHVLAAHAEAMRQVAHGAVEGLIADSSLGLLQRMSTDPRLTAEKLGYL